MEKDIQKALKELAEPERVAVLSSFFKTGPGEYGEGDVFIGVTVPNVRKVARRFAQADEPSIHALLDSPIHEERLCALLILVHRFENGDDREKKRVYDLYLASTDRINNWDLVDVTAHKVVGAHLVDRSRKPLYALARSASLWERRIAIISCFAFIRRDDLTDAFKLAEILLNDEHDLMHKAVGWVLREAGKRNLEAVETFLVPRYRDMPRTMLRYAIERFPEARRQAYLKGTATA